MYNLKQTSYFSWIYSELFMSKQIVLIEKLCYKAILIKRGALSWPGTIVHSCQTNISPKTPAHYNLGKIKCLEKTRVSVGPTSFTGAAYTLCYFSSKYIS